MAFNYASLLGDSNSGLLASATSAGKDILLDKTQDSNVLHPLLAGLLGDGGSTPSPATAETKPAPAVANIPQGDLAAPGGFFSQNKTLLMIGAGLVVAFVVLRAMK